MHAQKKSHVTDGAELCPDGSNPLFRMKFLKNTRWFAKPTLDTLFSELQGWYTYEEFGETLKKEQNRSDRTGLPFAYVQIDLARNGQTPELENAEMLGFIRHLTDIVEENTRNYDIKFITRGGVIGILLIDTSMDGAKFFIEKITHTLYNYFQDVGKAEFIHNLQDITISSYPVNRIKDEVAENRQDPPPLVLRKLRFTNGTVNSSNNTLFRENGMLKFDWQPLNITEGAATVDASYLWRNICEERAAFSYRFWKRVVDIFGALIGLLLFSPLIILFALLIKTTSRGPLIYSQQRIGQLMQPFTFYKFRTMRPNNDNSIHKQYVQKLIEGNGENQGSGDEPVYKLKDPRVTPIGQILRKTSMDEIPQLFNVLKGEMSLVGPRPPIDYEVEKYQSWHLRRIFEAKPGVTGLWQVYGRSKTTFDEMVRLDLQYVENRSILLDLKIILLTFSAIFKTNQAR